MMRIREQQLFALESSAPDDFTEDMIGHMRNFFPTHYRVLGEAGAREVIEYGCTQAVRHYMESERDTAVYITIMLLLGSNFDDDIQLPWASEILAVDSPVGRARRADDLCAKALAHLESIAGPKNVHLNRTLLRARSWLRALASGLGLRGRDIEVAVLAALREVFPRKADMLGELLLRRVIHSGFESARRFRAATDLGMIACATLAFLAGTGFATDPQLRPVHGVLWDPNIADPDRRASLLVAAASAHLDRWLSLDRQQV